MMMLFLAATADVCTMVHLVLLVYETAPAGVAAR